MAKAQPNRAHKPSADQKGVWRILSRIGIVLLILIPTYLAIISYVLVKNAPEEIIQTYYTAVDLKGPNGFSVSGAPASAGEDETDGSVLFDTFVSMLESGIYSPHIPTETHAWRYEVVMSTNTAKEYYTFYFSPDDTAAYYETEGGTKYRTEDAAAKDFLNGPYAFELYVAATPPVLTTAATDEIIPSEMSWAYQTQDGTFSDLTQLPLADGTVTYPIANDVAFYFSIEPTNCHLVIRDGDEIIHDENTLDGISLPWLTQGKTLDFEIEAFWTQSSASDYYGSAVYKFRMVVVEAASFSLNTTQSTLGHYFLLTCHNLKNEQKLVITGEPALPATPIVFRHGETVYAVVPASRLGSQQLTATYGTVSSSFSLSVLDREDAAHHVFAPAQLRGDWSSALSGELSALIIEKSADGVLNATTFPGANFAFPVASGAPAIVYGDRITLDGASVSNTVSTFEYYKTSGAVLAMSHGRVLECGEDALLGSYVIVDHGCGLYTWYCGLSAIHKSVGDAIAVGDTLGVAGRSGLGFENEDGILVFATWGKGAISLDSLRAQLLPL